MTPAKILGLLLVILYVVALRVFEGLDIRSVFEPPLLLPLLNTLFHGIIPIIVAYAAGKSYLKSGSVTVLFMGCGMLAFGLCAISAGWVIREPDGPNMTVTIHNTGVFLASFFHATGAMLASFRDVPGDVGRRKPTIVVSYCSVSLFLLCFSFAAIRGLIPPFFIQGVGPTELRQAVLGSSLMLYFISAIFFMTYYVKVKSDFLYWYSLCLALICIGLFGIFIQKAVGSPMGWLARSALYIGSIFSLTAIVSALKDAKGQGKSLEQSIVDSFHHTTLNYGRRLIPVLPIPIFLLLLVIVASLDLKTVVEPPGLFAALNTLFLTILPLSVVYFATRNYLSSGFFTMLMLGNGALTLGLGSLLSGWTLTLQGGGPNASTTIFNMSSLFSAIFHLLSGVSVFAGRRPGKVTLHKGLTIAFAYLGVVLLLGTLTLVTMKDLVPMFFLQGQGPTSLRQTVLGSAVALFTISGLLLLTVHLLSKARMLYWYSVALLLIATGLICYMGNTLFGGPIGWLGRFALYLAGVYLLVAVISATRELRRQGESQEEGIRNLFRHHLESLVEERTLQLQTAHNELERANAELSQTNQRLRALMEALPVGVSFSNDVSCQRITGNPCLFAQFDSPPDDNLSASAPDPTAPGRLVRFFHHGRKIQGTELPLQRAVAENRVIPPIELEIQLPDGRSWFAEASGAPIRDDQGNVVGGVAVTVDITQRKEAEEKLERAHKTLAEAQKIAHMGSFEYVAATQTTVWSEEEYRIYGLDPAGPSPTYDLMLQNCIHPEDAALLHETFSQAMQSRSVYELEHRILLPDGSVRWVYDRAHPYFDEQGEIARYVGTTLDITDRKMAEEALQQSEEKFRSIFDNSPLGVVHADAKGIVTACNDSFVRIVGTPLEKMIGLNSIRDLNDENLMAAVREALAGGKGHYEGQYTSRISNKTIHIKADIAPMFNQDGSVVGAIGIYEDIAARMQMERELRESEQRNRFLAHVIESSSQPFGVGRLDGCIVMANKAYGDLVGYTAEEMRHADWAKVLTPPQYIELESAKLADLIATRTPVRYEKEYIRKDGTRVPVELLVHIETNETGEQVYYSFITDLTERKQAEQALKESEERLRLAQSSANVGVWEWHLRSGVLFWTKELESIYGYEEGTFPGTYQSFSERLHPDDRAEVERLWKEAVKASQPFDFDFRIQLPSGETRWVNCKGSAHYDKAGNAERMLGVYVDITERKQIEQVLKESEKRIASDLKALTQMHALTTIASASREFKAVLQEIMNVAVAIVGADRGTLQLIEGDSLNLVSHCGHERPFTEFFATVTSQASVCGEAMKHNERVIVEDVEISPLFTGTPSLEVLRSAGVRAVQSTPLINRNGNLIGILTTQWSVPHTPDKYDLWRIDLLAQQATDFIENWRAREALRKSHDELEMRVQERTAEVEKAKEAMTAERQRLYDVLETLPVYVCLLDSDYHMPFANRYFRETFAEPLGRRCHDFLFNLTEPCEICETYTVMKTHSPHHWYWTGPNGRDYDIYDFPFFEADGSMLILEMGIDITERNKAEASLKQTLAELTRSNAELQQFAYVASHDLQEPLRNVASCLQMLEKKYKNSLDAEADKFIHYAVEGSVRMKALIVDLLAYSRVGAKGKPRERTDCEQVLDQAVKNLRVAISEAEAVITHDSLPTIFGDDSQLLLVFQNLIQNAIKFRRDEPPRIHMSAVKNKTEWIFSVRDRGIGIESNQLDRIFGIFQRLHKRDQYEGTGIGLAIVKKVVERHGGRIWVESERGAGSTFYFTIPEKGKKP